jgi:UPF0716 protein FxsA
MGMWVFALFLSVPLIEIALFVTVGGWLTLWPTLAVVVGTGFLGVFILRQQGLRAVSDMQSAMQNMQNPLSPMANSAMIMMAGILLILPGFLTDTLGLLLLLPPVRHWVISHLAGKMGVFSTVGPGPDWRNGPQAQYDDEAIDAEYSEIDPERPSLRGNSRWTQD